MGACKAVEVGSASKLSRWKLLLGVKLLQGKCQTFSACYG